MIEIKTPAKAFEDYLRDPVVSEAISRSGGLSEALIRDTFMCGARYALTERDKIAAAEIERLQDGLRTIAAMRGQPSASDVANMVLKNIKPAQQKGE